jgi:hypothetical protein
MPHCDEQALSIVTKCNNGGVIAVRWFSLTIYDPLSLTNPLIQIECKHLRSRPSLAG